MGTNRVKLRYSGVDSSCGYLGIDIDHFGIDHLGTDRINLICAWSVQIQIGIKTRRQKHDQKYVRKYVQKHVQKYVQKYVQKHVQKYVKKYVQKCVQ